MTGERCNGRCDSRQSTDPDDPDFPDADCPTPATPPTTAYLDARRGNERTTEDA